MQLVWQNIWGKLALVLHGSHSLPYLLLFEYGHWEPSGKILIKEEPGEHSLVCSFLAAIYVAIGIFASALTENQIIAFILAFLISFFFYQGFDFISTITGHNPLIRLFQPGN
jgi:ABC-2 type transport system permease protein